MHEAYTSSPRRSPLRHSAFLDDSGPTLPYRNHFDEYPPQGMSRSRSEARLGQMETMFDIENRRNQDIRSELLLNLENEKMLRN